MIYISKDNNKNDVINLTRGDDATLTVALYNDDDGSEEQMGDQEYLIFGIREAPTEDAEIILEIQSDPGSNTITIAHNDTNDLAVGFYSAEVQLMRADGRRVTVWPKLTDQQRTSKSNRRNFCLMTEVIRA